MEDEKVLKFLRNFHPDLTDEEFFSPTPAYLQKMLNVFWTNLSVFSQSLDYYLDGNISSALPDEYSADLSFTSDVIQAIELMVVLNKFLGSECAPLITAVRIGSCEFKNFNVLLTYLFNKFLVYKPKAEALAKIHTDMSASIHSLDERRAQYQKYKNELAELVEFAYQPAADFVRAEQRHTAFQTTAEEDVAAIGSEELLQSICVLEVNMQKCLLDVQKKEQLKAAAVHETALFVQMLEPVEQSSQVTLDVDCLNKQKSSEASCTTELNQILENIDRLKSGADSDEQESLLQEKQRLEQAIAAARQASAQEHEVLTHKVEEASEKRRRGAHYLQESADLLATLRGFKKMAIKKQNQFQDEYNTKLRMTNKRLHCTSKNMSEIGSRLDQVFVKLEADPDSSE